MDTFEDQVHAFAAHEKKMRPLIDATYRPGSADEIDFPDGGRRDGRLFVGDWDFAHNYYALCKHDIGVVFNCTDDKRPNPHAHRLIAHYTIDIDDCETQDEALLGLLKRGEILEKIDAALVHNNVLLHCHQGVSRSPTIAACYLIRYYNFTRNEAVSFIQKSRPKTFHGNKKVRGGAYFTFRDTLQYYDEMRK